MIIIVILSCPLCRGIDIADYHEDQRRKYQICSTCSLVFVPEAFHLSESEEKRIYDLHENDPYDPGYRRFLSRLANPLLERLEPGSKGLDFGCGPGPGLAMMLEEKGHAMSLFDIFYQNDPHVLRDSYDFICATEVLEHLRRPGEELDHLVRMLVNGGYLGIMTKLVLDREAFSRWHYIQDQTHICFFSKETFMNLAKRFKCELTFIGTDVIFFRKGRGGK